MKKWILIGIIVLAVSAIAASRIRNNGITLDDYFSLDDTGLRYKGAIYSQANSYAYTDSTGSNNSLIFINAERGSTGELSSYLKSGYDDTIQYSDIGIISESASNKTLISIEWGSNENSDYADALLKVARTAQEFYLTNISGDYIFRVSNTQAPSSSLLAGEGNAFACLDSDGKLYRSATSCA